MEITRRDMVVGVGGLALAGLAAVRGLGVGAGRDTDEAFRKLRPEAIDAGYSPGESLDPDFRFMAH